MKIAKLLFCAFIFCMVCYSRTFAYVHIMFGSIPFYVTEIVLGLTLVLLFLRSCVGEKHGLSFGPLDRIIILFNFMGLIFLWVGYSQYGIQAARNAAVIYYTLFYFIAKYLVDTHEMFHRVCICFLLGCLLPSFDFLFNLKESVHALESLSEIPETFRLSGPAQTFYFNIAIVFIVALFRNIRHKKVMGLILSILLLEVVLALRRTNVIALPAAFLLMYLVAQQRLRRHIGRFILTALLGISIFIGMVYFYGGAAMRYIDRYTTALAYGEEGNATWRLSVWHEAINEFLDHPTFGIGFGRGATYNVGTVEGYGPDLRMDIHNSHLQLLERTGAGGFIIYIILHYRFLKICLSFIRKHSNSPYIPHMVALLGAYTTVMIYAAFNVVLEGPYMGIFLWVIMGLGVALIRIHRRYEALYIQPTSMRSQ